MSDIHKSVYRLTAIGTVIATLASLVACTGNGSNAESNTLTFPSHFWTEPASRLWWTSVNDKFEKAHPDAHVAATPVPFADYFNKVYTQMSSGQAPDIVVPYDPQVGQWAKEELLEPLDSCFERHNIDTSKLLPTQKVAEFDGKTYGLLAFHNPRVLVYNQQLLDQAGVRAPKDLSQFKDAIAAMTDRSKQQYGFVTVTGATTPDDTYLGIMPIVAGFGGAFVTDGKPTADSKQTVAALSFLKGLYDDGQLPKGMNGAASQDAFVSGKIGSFIVGPFIVGQARDKNPAVAKHLNAELLPLPGGRTVSVNVFLSIPRGAKNKQAACDYLATTLDPQLQKTTSAQLSALPATGTVDPAFLRKNPYFKAAMEASKVSVSYAPRGAEAHMGEIQRIVTNVYQEMLTTSMTGAEAGAEIQSELVELLND